MSHHIISSSGSDRSTGQGGERQLRKTAQAAREEEKEGVREGEQGVRDGEAGGWNEAELDYEEDIEEDGRQIRRNSEEDEVKVHSMEVIEEGELSSGEEGEIKDESESSSEHTQHTSHSSPQHNTQTTPTGDHGNSESEKAETEGKGESDSHSKDDEQEEKEESDREEATGGGGGGKIAARAASPHRESRMAGVCRHFLQGKCSWGKDCRFSHDDRALATADLHTARYHQPRLPPLPGPHQMRGGGPHGFPGPFGHPHHPGSEFSHHPLPREGVERDPFYLPCDEPRGGGEVAQVAEESEGWYRLRTVPNHWSSDEDKPHKPRNIKDSPKSSRKRVGEQKSHDSDGEERAKKKKPGRTTKHSSSSSEEEEEVMRRKKSKSRSAGGSERKKGSHKREAGSSSEEVSRTSGTSEKRRKRRQHSSDSASDGEGRGYKDYGYPFPPHPHRDLPHHYPPPPNDRYLRPPDPSFHAFGPPRFLHGPPSQGHVLLEPYGPPPLPPHGHYIDRYGPPPYHEWHRAPGRDHRLKHSRHPSSPPQRERQKRRRDHNSDSSPEHSHSHRKKKASESPRKKTDRTMDRREQLLQELTVINKVIERKKQKSAGKKRDSS